MNSILDQLDNYYAKKRSAALSDPAIAPSSLRHPNAEEFFANLMQRQKSGTANGNASRTMETRHETPKRTTGQSRVENPAFESALVSA